MKECRQSRSRVIGLCPGRANGIEKKLRSCVARRRPHVPHCRSFANRPRRGLPPSGATGMPFAGTATCEAAPAATDGDGPANSSSPDRTGDFCFPEISSSIAFISSWKNSSASYGRYASHFVLLIAKLILVGVNKLCTVNMHRTIQQAPKYPNDLLL